MSLDEVYSVLLKNKKESIDLLFEFLKIPSIAAQNIGEEASINFLERIFGETRFNCSTFETNGFAVFTAELNTGSDKTITFYDHYDVQPVNIDLWESPPFEPTIRNGKIFARGVADNKGEIICRLQAIKAYIEVFGKIPVNIKFILEGEEEIGSLNLGYFVENNKEFALGTDLCIWEFGDKDTEGIHNIYLGVKGCLYLELKTDTIGMDVHSGRTQFVDNAAYELAWALAALKDRNDKILVPGFYDNIPKPTEEELKNIDNFNLKEEELKKTYGIDKIRLGLSGVELKRKFFLEPTINICGFWSGYQGPGSKTIAPHEAFAKVDCRLVPGQNSKDLVEKIRKFWDDNGFSHIEIIEGDGYDAVKTSPANPVAQAVIQAVSEVSGHDPVVWPLAGGSGPMCLFPGVPCISIGTSHSQSNAHAPNENIYINDWIEGMKTIATLIHKF
ncbi:MAG: M20/M25/M40 family metallo-hydrolase [Candidatus Lokiarchaeota archaeon]|nr:M20/M25/M40 family metallo-hydrolase [Candidatus Lokiarchaeota archaeon]